jgi:UDP-N-acetylmuramoyl-tripeptide--D-alanyl-D-alanine ligase
MAGSFFSRAVDWVATDVKSAAKVLYRRPVIATARLWRRALRDTCCIGITGSAAKTTTKELLHAMLAVHASSVRNSDSNNQLYSVARTLLATRPQTEFCVQELGAFEPGGLTPMLSLLRPRVAVITTIGIDHFTSFRTPAAVALEKSALVAAVPADGLSVLNADDDLVAAMAGASRSRVVTYGIRRPADYRATILHDAWPQRLALRIAHAQQTVEVTTQLCGAHQSVPVLAAIAAACSLGLTLRDAAHVASQFRPLLARMSVNDTPQGVTIIRDDWKAPRWSLPIVFEYLRNAKASRKILVLGSVSDVGGNRGQKYRRTIEAALAAADFVVAVGASAMSSVAGRFGPDAAQRLATFATVEEASNWLWRNARRGDLVLLKGSNHADHLARIALAAERNVSCWRQRCDRDIFCDQCRLIDSAAR